MGIKEGNLSDMINGKNGRKIVRLIAHLNDKYNGKFDIPDEEKENEVSDVHLVEEQDKRPYTTNSNGIKFYEQEDGSLLMEVPKVGLNVLGSPDDEFADLPNLSDEYETELIPVDKVYHGKYFTFEVDGDSMDDGTRDSFERGDFVVVRELDRSDWQPKLHISKWKNWVVCWNNCVRLKQIIQQEGDIITLHSLNPSPEYTDFDLDLNNVSRLFNVIMKKPKPIRYGNY